MGRGIVEVPLISGPKKLELAWYVGRAVVNNQGAVPNQPTPTINVHTERDADFMAKRLWLVQWPNPGVPSLAMPVNSQVKFTDGRTKNALNLVGAASGALALNTDKTLATSAWLGLPCPYLVRGNNSVYADISLAAQPVNDLYMVLEGYKIYPGQQDKIPQKIQAYSLPYGVDGNAVTTDPSVFPNSIAGQFITITNNGQAQALLKGFNFRCIDAAGNDVTEALKTCLAFQLTDSSSGVKKWIQDTSQGATYDYVPASVFDMHGSFLPWNTPRYLDPNGVIQLQIIWSNLPAALAFVHAAAVWPVTFHVNFFGAAIPK